VSGRKCRTRPDHLSRGAFRNSPADSGGAGAQAPGVVTRGISGWSPERLGAVTEAPPESEVNWVATGRLTATAHSRRGGSNALQKENVKLAHRAADRRRSGGVPGERRGGGRRKRARTRSALRTGTPRRAPTWHGHPGHAPGQDAYATSSAWRSGAQQPRSPPHSANLHPYLRLDTGRTDSQPRRGVIAKPRPLGLGLRNGNKPSPERARYAFGPARPRGTAASAIAPFQGLGALRWFSQACGLGFAIAPLRG
jgi:hypothetical protein